MGKDPFSKVAIFRRQYTVHLDRSGENYTIRNARAFLPRGPDGPPAVAYPTYEARIDAFVGKQINRQ
jgi:hypothetical protein